MLSPLLFALCLPFTMPATTAFALFRPFILAKRPRSLEPDGTEVPDIIRRSRT